MVSPAGNDRPEKQLEHVHVCPKCDLVLGPDKIELCSIVTGIITCPKCDWSGPINLQIVEKKRPSE
jgi:hypothetical protein